MKTAIPKLAALLCLFVLLNAFSTTQPIEHPAKKTKEALSCFVVMKDGTIKQYTSLELVTGIFKTPHLLADGSITITASDIKAYQDKNLYAISQKEFTTLKPSKVAVEALPGFAVRIAQGRLNVYSLKFYNGHNTSEKLFIQSGDSGQIAAYTPELLNDLIKDNQEVYSYFNASDKSTTAIKKMLTTVEMYNTSRLISKN